MTWWNLSDSSCVAWLDGPEQMICKKKNNLRMLMNIVLFFLHGAWSVLHSYELLNKDPQLLCCGFFYHGIVQLIIIKFGRFGWMRLTVQSCHRGNLCLFFLLFLSAYLIFFISLSFLSFSPKIHIAVKFVPSLTSGFRSQWVMTTEVDVRKWSKLVWYASGKEFGCSIHL